MNTNLCIRKSVAVVAVIVAGAVGFITSRLFSHPDTQLLQLVERLIEGERSSAIVAVGTVAAAAILAAVIIPTVTVFAVIRHERNEIDDQNSIYLGEERRQAQLTVSQWPDVDPDNRRHNHPDSKDRTARQLLTDGYHRTASPNEKVLHHD